MKGKVSEVSTRTGADKYPDELRHLFKGRHKAKLGEYVGITQFGVNYTTLEPGSASALRHWHEGEDEFIYILSGELTLVTSEGEHSITPGEFAGFPANDPNGHQLVNRSTEIATFIEVGSRKPGADTVHYPDHNIEPVQR